MKIRIISNVMYKADQVFSPGLILEMDDEQAAEWIEQGKAIAFDNEPKPAPRKVKEVKDGNG